MIRPTKTIAVFTAILAVVLMLSGCQGKQKLVPDYSEANMWAFNETSAQKQADLFIVPTTVYYGDENSFNMPIDDQKNRERIVGALNMQLGIYNETLKVISPYYRQASISSVESGDYQTAADIAYSDVAAAFEYYMKNMNHERPFVLAGFSQGAHMCLRLMKDYPEYLSNMIACYMNGWPITESDLKDNPQIVPATGETDTGVVVCFNCEAPQTNDTFTVPAGTKSVCINPLNWKTDGTPAEKELNKGACFMDYSGSIETEAPAFTGAYIDESRGTLKLPDVEPEDYKSKLSFLKYGEYHLFDYEFFYRNLQENVQTRVQSWFEK